MAVRAARVSQVVRARCGLEADGEVVYPGSRLWEEGIQPRLPAAPCASAASARGAAALLRWLST